MNYRINKMILSLLTLLTITILAGDSNTKHYVSVTHEIADFENWKALFDKDTPLRKEAEIIDVFVMKDINNPKIITVLMEISNLEKANAFFSSPRLKEAMGKAGVVGAPEISMFTLAEEFKPINTSSLITTVSHSVKDYSKWKAVYDSANELRKKAGVNDYLLLRSLSDENLITVIGTSTSAEKFNKFITNPDLKTVMEKAGVTSKPVVKVLQ